MSATFVDYKGVLVASEDPTGDAGLAINNNFKILADRTYDPNLFLDFVDGQSVPVSGADQGRIRYNSSTQSFEFSENGGAWADLSGVGPGTTNRIAKFTAANAVGNSGITDSGAGEWTFRDATNQIAAFGLVAAQFSVADTAGQNVTLRARDANGGNRTGGDLIMRPGFGSGSAHSGTFRVGYSTAPQQDGTDYVAFIMADTSVNPDKDRGLGVDIRSDKDTPIFSSVFDLTFIGVDNTSTIPGLVADTYLDHTGTVNTAFAGQFGIATPLGSTGTTTRSIANSGFTTIYGTSTVRNAINLDSFFSVDAAATIVRGTGLLCEPILGVIPNFAHITLNHDVFVDLPFTGLWGIYDVGTSPWHISDSLRVGQGVIAAWNNGSAGVDVTFRGRDADSGNKNGSSLVFRPGERTGTGTGGSVVAQGNASNDLPTFDVEFLGAAGWTSTDWTGSWAAGWTHTSGNTTILSQSTAAVVGVKYQISYTVTGRTAGTFTLTFGGQTITGLDATGAFGPTATGVGGLQITPSNGFDGTIVLSIKAITAGSTALGVWKNSGGDTQLEVRGGSALYNTFVGLSAGMNTLVGGTGDGTFNNGFGYSALKQLTTGSGNTGIGYRALELTTTAEDNTALGVDALRENKTGSRNVAVGLQALTTANSNRNTAVGWVCGYSVTSGSNNVFMGYETGDDPGGGETYAWATTTASCQTLIGTETGQGSAAQSDYITCLGYRALADGANSMALGANAVASGANMVVIGDGNITTTKLHGEISVMQGTSDAIRINPSGRIYGHAVANPTPETALNLNHISDGTDVTINCANMSGPVPHNLCADQTVVLAGWTWADGGGVVNGLWLVVSVTTSTFTITPISCPTAGTHPSVVGTVTVMDQLQLGGLPTIAGNADVLIQSTSSTRSPLMVQGAVDQGLPTLGAELLGATGWTSVDWTGSWSTGWDHTTGNTTALSNSIAAVTSTKYFLSWTVTGYTAGTFTITFGGSTYTPAASMLADGKGAFGVIASTTANLIITPTSTFDGALFLSLKVITAGSKPMESWKDSLGVSHSEVRFTDGSSAYGTNCFFGTDSGQYTKSNGFEGAKNAAFGHQAMGQNISGHSCSAFGFFALSKNVSGQWLTAIGQDALQNAVDCNECTAVGQDSMISAVSGVSNCVAVGGDTMYNLTSGSYNACLGNGCLNALVVGSYNLALGQIALGSGSTFSYCTAIGYQAAAANDTDEILAIGYNALVRSVSGIGSQAIGTSCLTNSVGNHNCAAGFHSGENVQGEGEQNTLFGALAGTAYYESYTLTTGAANTFIGFNACIDNAIGAGVQPSNSIAIGSRANVWKSNQAVIGNSSVTETILRGSVGMSGADAPTTGVNSSFLKNESITEEITCATGATIFTSSAHLLPAFSYIIGVTARVTQAPADAVTWKMGIAGTDDKFAEALQPKTLGQTTHTLATGHAAGIGGPAAQLPPFPQATDDHVVITFSADPGATAAKIRVTVFYQSLTPPQS